MIRPLATLLGIAIACAAPAAEQAVPITVGETHTLSSNPLAQQRVVNVDLPVDYAAITSRLTASPNLASA